ncbi:hypothetical protein PG993_011620 [Apiospora rasikravindrae]|uniref:Sugar phosphate phosphatase n=1 Tax=Apiospora rasikravindrae TaxID=990691 RepID=A0ABR1S2C9_9PEZI
MPRSATSRPAPYSTADPTSFGHETARRRWPTIITGVIDDLTKAVFQHVHVKSKVDEGCAIIANIQDLKDEILEGAALCPLKDDGSPEIAAYNEELMASAKQTWHNSPWLFCECYLFKRISTYFNLSEHWKNYDGFMNQKMDTFRSSLPAVAELAARYRGLATHREDAAAAAPGSEEIIFREIFEICLWGNATDLSLLTNLSYEDIQKLQGSEARKAAESNILVNDLSRVCGQLKRAQEAGKPSRVDIVLDNSGFELYVDLLLAGYLLSSGLAQEVVFHPKNIPWFVSDVTPADFDAIMGVLADPARFFGDANSSSSLVEDLSFLSSQLEGFRKEGRVSLRTSSFWTLPCGFAALPRADPALFAELRASGLVIFKGDLNYRKLTGDRAWAPTTPFAEAITAPAPGRCGDDEPSSSLSVADLNVLALRTCKADVVVGLAPGRDEELRAATDPEYDASAGSSLSGPRRWAWSGKWAVIQFSQAR